MHPVRVAVAKNIKNAVLVRKEAEAVEMRKIMEQNLGKAMDEVDDLNDLSNSVVDLIGEKKFDEAETVCHEFIAGCKDSLLLIIDFQVGMLKVINSWEKVAGKVN
ncbi:MAG: hypothetical protein R6U27_15290, partial [Desulfobacterales bacterium]